MKVVSHHWKSQTPFTTIIIQLKHMDCVGIGYDHAFQTSSFSSSSTIVPAN